jgi:hypothetical protein
MNYKEFYKDYCSTYNWHNNGLHKIYCNPHCPHFLGLSKRNKDKIIILIPLCEYEEEKIYN